MIRFLFVLFLCFYIYHPVFAAMFVPNWSQHIQSHTANEVSKDAELHIRFVHDVVNEEALSQDAALFLSIKPKLAGKAEFLNRRELVFKPQELLKSGQSYDVQLDTSKLSGFDAELGMYHFKFHVMKQHFSILLDQLKLEPQGKSLFHLSGTLETADVVENEKVEQLLQASMSSKKLSLTWQHAKDQKRHRFFIEGIQRQAQVQRLLLAWHGQAIAVDNKGEHPVEIPALLKFKVVNVKAVQNKQRYTLIQFSSDLDTKQDLTGLIQMNQTDYPMRVEGNVVKVFHSLLGDVSVELSAGIKNKQGIALTEKEVKVVNFVRVHPQVHFVGKGVILPANKHLSIPFEAINVKSVQVTAFQVYDDNMGQFFQGNSLAQHNNLRRLGRFIWRKTIDLKDMKTETWNRYELDASSLLKKHAGAMFRLKLSINRSNASYQCSDAENAVPVVKEKPLQNAVEAHYSEASAWDNTEEYFGLNDNSSWEDRRDPCKDAYYYYSNKTKSERNFLASNIGLIIKASDQKKQHIVTTNLATAKAMPRVKIQFFNFQNQLIGRAQTDAYGFARKQLSQTPFYAVAQKGKQKGYLKLSKGSALPISHFDVSGEKVKQGVKGHIYAERGVWRPGDDMHLTFVLLDKENKIPQKHPVTMRLYSPRGQLMQTVSNTAPIGRFYSFTMKTADNAKTGNWMVKAHLGGMVFHKKIRIETVRPNRLKVTLDFGTEVLRRTQGDIDVSLSSQWLHGASASGLKADVKVALSASRTSFKSFQDYRFDDATRPFSATSKAWFKGKLNAEGKVLFKKALPEVKNSPGMLMATFHSRVFEKGGMFSVDYLSVPYHPYKNYVGLKLPKGDAIRGMLLTDEKHPIYIATVDSYGEPVSLNKVKVSVYKIHWKWWWDKTGDSLAQYASSSYQSSIMQEEISTTNGDGVAHFEIKYPDWGRYLVRACDEQGGHCSSKVIYVDWPGWAGRAQESSGTGATRLSLNSDKTQYQVGDVAAIRLPDATQGRALLSIESSSQVLQQKWILLDGKRKNIKVKITKAMAPNAYVHISLIQPHQGKNNDLPIRLYGIVPIQVSNPETVLQPMLDVEDEVRPERAMQVDVSEKTGRAMTYTLAIVDEGLLSLTRYKTPDLHKAFYKKEALGVSTWDLFDEVVGAYGGKLERLLALGGGDAAKNKKLKNKKKRFPPVVQFLGPFQLKAGETAEHDILLPQYIGAVRVMLVAGGKQAYGKADKTVLVRDPLSMLVTMPRVLGPDEILTVPVSLFAMNDDIHDVRLKVKVDEHLEVVGDATQTVHFDKVGEQMGFIQLKVKSKAAKTTIHFSADSKDHHASSTLHLDIRLPNAPTQHRYQQAIEAGKSWSTQIVPHGVEGSNRVSLEVSTLPPMNLNARLNYLITYPHGCVEQTTSSVFPQVFLPDLIHVDEEKASEMEKNVKAGVNRLQRFQQNNGSFSYWPGTSDSHDWASSYVGHFLLHAKQQGYAIPSGMLERWLSYQQKAANSWVANSQNILNQSYRLYTLALAAKPELGAMNRLRESKQLNSLARWQLSSAYYLSGLKDAAQSLIKDDLLQVDKNIVKNQHFSSYVRNQALLLYALALKNDPRGVALAKEVAAVLSSERSLNTQEVVFSLLALTTYANHQDKPKTFRFEQIVGVNSEPVQLSNAVYMTELGGFSDKGDVVGVLNHSNQTLYTTVIVDGVPKAGHEKASSEGLSMQVLYQGSNHKAVDIRRLKQGQDITVVIKVRNRTHHAIEHLALSHILPSGWEITHAGKEGVTHQDIRDDRIYRYFSLARGEEKIFKLQLNASYLGKSYMPAISVEDMYDAKIHARGVGEWVEVVKE
ncbi:MAG: MG2 domain-containing protein [Mariprofundaceae bacterium]|nr:MG2 domain-containing protein [Mariprofundaceae bacterium]